MEKKYMRFVKLTNQGFTLVELLIVIAIIGILAVGVMAAINPIEQLAKSRDAGSVKAVGDMIGALQRYELNNGANYPWGAATVDHANMHRWDSNSSGVAAMITSRELRSNFNAQARAAVLYVGNFSAANQQFWACFQPSSQSAKSGWVGGAGTYNNFQYMRMTGCSDEAAPSTGRSCTGMTVPTADQCTATSTEWVDTGTNVAECMLCMTNN